jgi:hypothetical protein
MENEIINDSLDIVEEKGVWKSWKNTKSISYSKSEMFQLGSKES